MSEPFESGNQPSVFHAAFATRYLALARQKYARFLGRFPYHGQDVHILYGGNRWWHIVCISGQRFGDIRIGPVGRYSLQSVNLATNPDLIDLPDESQPRKEEFRLALGIDNPIYHEAFAPPGPPGDDELTTAGAAVAERLVEEQARPFVELETLRTKVANMRNAHQLLNDMDETLACLHGQHFRAAVVTSSAAAESALVGRLEELGHPIRQEERGHVLGHEHHSFSLMVAEAYRGGRLSAKTRDGLELLNGMRRGTDHCRPDATMEDDAHFAWGLVQQLLRELAK